MYTVRSADNLGLFQPHFDTKSYKIRLTPCPKACILLLYNNTDATKGNGGMKTTSQVADMFGMDKRHINMILSRHHELRPANKIVLGGFSAYQWADDEIEALRQYLQSIGSSKGDPQEGKGE